MVGPQNRYDDPSHYIFQGLMPSQIWGFEIVNGERRHTRRIAVAKGGKYEIIRFVYTFKGRDE